MVSGEKRVSFWWTSDLIFSSGRLGVLVVSYRLGPLMVGHCIESTGPVRQWS